MQLNSPARNKKLGAQGAGQKMVVHGTKWHGMCNEMHFREPFRGVRGLWIKLIPYTAHFRNIIRSFIAVLYWESHYFIA